MPSLTAPPRRAGRLLAGHVRRLRRALEALAAQVRAAVARAVGQATGDAVRDALTVILDGPPTDSSSGRDPPGEPGFWPGPRRQPWGGRRYDDHDPYEATEHRSEPEYGHYDDEPDEAEAPARQPTGRWARAVATGCQAAGWWLRRHPGPFALAVAAGVGAAAGVAALVGGPFVTVGSAAVASVLGVLALADAARAAASLAGDALT